MIYPNELDDYNVNYNKLEKEIDNSIKECHGMNEYEQAFVKGEYPVNMRNTIAQKYKNAGWKYVYHITSSEVGGPNAVSMFIFSMKKLDGEDVLGYYIV